MQVIPITSHCIGIVVIPTSNKEARGYSYWVQPARAGCTGFILRFNWCFDPSNAGGCHSDPSFLPAADRSYSGWGSGRWRKGSRGLCSCSQCLCMLLVNTGTRRSFRLRGPGWGGTELWCFSFWEGSCSAARFCTSGSGCSCSGSAPHAPVPLHPVRVWPIHTVFFSVSAASCVVTSLASCICTVASAIGACFAAAAGLVLGATYGRYTWGRGGC
jgi:hypothetical protein